MASTMKDFSWSFVSSNLSSVSSVSSINESSHDTFFEDSDIKYKCISSLPDIESFHEESYSSQGSLATSSSSRTFFEDSGVRYRVGNFTNSRNISPIVERTRSLIGSLCADSFNHSMDASPTSPKAKSSLVSSSFESSTGTFFEDSNIRFVDESRMLDTKEHYFLDHLEDTVSSAGTYFEESSPSSFTSSLDSAKDDSNSITSLEESLSESNKTTESFDTFVHLNMSDIRLINNTGNKLQISVPLKMFHKKLLQTLTRR